MTFIAGQLGTGIVFQSLTGYEDLSEVVHFLSEQSYSFLPTVSGRRTGWIQGRPSRPVNEPTSMHSFFNPTFSELLCGVPPRVLRMLCKMKSSHPPPALCHFIICLHLSLTACSLPLLCAHGKSLLLLCCPFSGIL